MSTVWKSAVSVVIILLVCPPPISLAGDNPDAKLAMHLVASNEYLYCEDLTPVSCDSINVDVSVAEIVAANGYGYVAFLAYDVEGITGAEFAVTGRPSGRSAPILSGPYWCPDGALTLGDHLDGGGITSFPCASASESGIVLIGYCSFGPLGEEDLPITLEYTASSFSYPGDPHDYVLDCTIEYQEDTAAHTTGCTIGGVSQDTLLCSTAEGMAVGGVDPPTALGNRTVTLEVSGQGFGPGTCFSLTRTETDSIRANPGYTVTENCAVCSFDVARSDTGYWNVSAVTSDGENATLQDALYVNGLAGDDENGFLAGRVIVHFHHGALDLGNSRDSAERCDVAYVAPAVESVMDGLGVHRIEKVFKGSVPYDTLATTRNGEVVRVEDVSQFYVLHAPETEDVLAGVRAFRDLPEVVYAEPDYWHSAWGVPNDKYVAENPKQWGLHNTGQDGGTYDADIDAPAAWDIETGSSEVTIFINDSGVHHQHRDLGGEYGPGHKVAGGYNFLQPGQLPEDIDGHGTMVAGVAGALTNNRCDGGNCGESYHGGVAGVAGGWGNQEGTGSIGCPLYAVKVCQEGGCPYSSTVAGLDYARQNGAWVVNMSYGGPNQSEAQQVAIHNCAQEGIALVASMGNCYPRDCYGPTCNCYDGTGGDARTLFPAGHHWDVVGVGATNRDDRRVVQADEEHIYYLPWSSMIGDHIAVVAPSLNHWTTTNTGGFYPFAGTSAAAPFVSGIAGLILSHCDRHWSPFCPMNADDVAAFIRISAEDIDWDPVYEDCPGWDIYTGAGRVNAYRSLYLCNSPNGFWKVDREHVTGGTATATGWGFTDYPFSYTQYRVSRTVTFAFSDTPSVWGNNRTHTTGTIPHPLTSDMLDWKYCRVVPTSVTPTQAELETYIYRRCNMSGQCDWVPTDAANVVFGYSVMPPPVWPTGSVEFETSDDTPAALSQNYPNPFNPATTLVYSVREPSRTEIAIYDVRGRQVIVLVDEEKTPGTYSVHWDGLDGEGRAVASGVYFCAMEAGGYRQIRKLVLTR